MKKIFLLFLVNMLLLPAFADQLVKQTKDNYVYPNDGTSWPFDLNCIASKISSVSVIIAPSSGDPGVQTANPISPKSGCPIYDSTGEGQPEHHFNLTFNSLRDLGTWQIQCVGHSVPPVACVSKDYPPCNVFCDTAYVTGYSNNPVTFNVTVFNNAPTAILSHSPTPTWNNTVTLNSNAADPDGGSLNYTWSITNRPSTSSKNLSSINTANPTITFNNDDDIGDWTFSVFIDDNEGERKTFTHSFTVPNIPPNISVGGNTNIDALQAINLSVTPTTDIDGGNLTFRWDILNAPAGSPIGLQNNYSTASTINIPPTDKNIGTWQFRVTATDDEGDTVSETINMTVNNLPPDIHFVGAHTIDVGETIQIETTVPNDADGGQLDFVWDIIQAPQASTINVQSGFHSGSGAAGASISLPTGFNEAGTWIFRLTATDDDGQPDSKIEKEFTLLVDGPVDAKITGPATIGSLSFPLTLNGTDSVDPDSPCVGTIDRCHDTLDSRPVTVSPDVVRYTWYLANVPSELFSEYPLGRIDEVFGISASGSSITLDFGDLKPGDWVFELEVVDAEGNTDRESFLVSVIDESGPPFAILNPTRRYEVDLANNVSENVVLNSGASFDSDNLISGGGVGIKQRQWNYVFSPTGCATPTLPSGINTSSFNLYNSGNTVSPSCQGYWGIGLTVTDDDIPAKTASASTGVIIGNCSSLLCIDYPKTLKPAVVEFTDNVDILIYYRLDSTLYDDPFFVNGMFTILEIYHESDLSTPVYTNFDPNVLATDKGSMLVFHWNGFTNPPLHLRPQSGRYSVRIKLANSLLAIAPVIEAVELDSILIAVAEPVIQPTSDRFIERAALTAGSDTLNVNYSVNGIAVPDQVRWRIKDASNSLVFERTEAPGGAISWNGAVTPGNTIAAGVYTLELELLRGGDVLGSNQTPYPFAVYEMSMTVATGAYPGAAGATPPEQLVMVNGDDDNGNSIVDSTENGPSATENDLQRIDLTFTPINLPPQLAANVKLAAHSGGPNVKVWDSANKTTNIPLVATYDLTSATPPAQVFIEGISSGNTELRWVLEDASAGTEVAHKAVLARVHNVDLDVDTNMDGTVNIDDDTAEMNDQAVIVYVNNDDDGGAGNDAVSNATIENAADKAELTVLTLRRNASIPPGGKMVLQVSDNTKLRIFNQSDNAVIGPPAADGGPNLSQHDIPNADITAGDLTYRIECVHGGLVTVSLILYNSAMTEISRDELKVALNVHRKPGNTFASVHNYLNAKKNQAGLEGIQATLAGAKPIVSWDPSPPISITTSYWISIQDNAVTNWLQTGVRALRSTTGVDTEELYFEAVSDYPGYRGGTNPTGYLIFTKAAAGWNMGDFKVEVTDRTTGEAQVFHGGASWRTVVDNAFKTAVFENYQTSTEPKQTVARTPGSAASKARVSAARYKDGTGWHNTAFAATDIEISATNGRGVTTTTTAVLSASNASADNRNFKRVSGNKYEFWDDRN